MPFTPTTWVDGNSPYITAAQLNRMEAGIDSLHDILDAGYAFAQSVRFTADGNFVKADYPWLRAIRVHAVGGGGGGGGAAATAAGEGSVGGGGGGGAYVWAWVTDIAALPASAPVIVGAGGTGVAGAAGSSGSTSSFQFNTTGSIIGASGGGGGQVAAAGAGPTFAQGGTNGAGGFNPFIVASGDPGEVAGYMLRGATPVGFAGRGGRAGGPFGGGSPRAVITTNDGPNVTSGYGAGGGGAANLDEFTARAARPGGNGRIGVVVLDLYA